MQTVRCSSIIAADSKKAFATQNRERCYSRYLTGFRVKWCKVNTCKILFSSSGEWNLFADIRTREEPGWNPNQPLAQPLQSPELRPCSHIQVNRALRAQREQEQNPQTRNTVQLNPQMETVTGIMELLKRNVSKPQNKISGCATHWTFLLLVTSYLLFIFHYNWVCIFSSQRWQDPHSLCLKQVLTNSPGKQPSMNRNTCWNTALETVSCKCKAERIQAITFQNKAKKYIPSATSPPCRDRSAKKYIYVTNLNCWYREKSRFYS